MIPQEAAAAATEAAAAAEAAEAAVDSLGLDSVGVDMHATNGDDEMALAAAGKWRVFHEWCFPYRRGDVSHVRLTIIFCLTLVMMHLFFHASL